MANKEKITLKDILKGGYDEFADEALQERLSEGGGKKIINRYPATKEELAEQKALHLLAEEVVDAEQAFKKKRAELVSRRDGMWARIQERLDKYGADLHLNPNSKDILELAPKDKNDE